MSILFVRVRLVQVCLANVDQLSSNRGGCQALAALLKFGCYQVRMMSLALMDEEEVG